MIYYPNTRDARIACNIGAARAHKRARVPAIIIIRGPGHRIAGNFSGGKSFVKIEI